MPDLQYKASSIARAERELNANFFATLEGLGDGTPSFTALLMILRAGGLSEDEADTYLDDNGIEVAMKEAVDALGRAGFLAKMKLTASQLANQSNEQTKASQTTGKTTKA